MKFFNMHKSFLKIKLLLIIVFIPFYHTFSQGVGYKKGELLIQLYDFHDKDKLISAYPQLKLLDVLIPEFNLIKIGFNSSMVDEKWIINKLKKVPFIKHVQYNHILSHRGLLSNDPEYPKQWNLNNTGQTNGINDADIDAPEAWTISTGGITADGDTIVVAVIDAGFDLNHEDVHFWTNHNEIPDNGIDDDENGYIDDVNGWNVYNNSGLITSDSHGTHVSGIIAAKGNNSIGVSGINWNTKIMAVQGDSDDESIVIKAYGYVFKQRKLYNETNGLKGAFIVSTNASFGVDYGKPNDFPLWCSIYDSLGSIGILSAAATANLNVDVDQLGDIPTTCSSDFLITVTNTTSEDKKYYGAAYGSKMIDLGAPGTNIYSTVSGNLYQNMTGTSMASPHVAGAVALMYAAACKDWIEKYKENPMEYSLLVKNIIINSTDSIKDLVNKTVSAGRLNINNSLLGITDQCNAILPPIVSNDTNCRDNPFNLIAKSSLKSAVIFWYDSLKQDPIFIGDTLITPPLQESTVYYAAAYDSSTGKKSNLVAVKCVVSNPKLKFEILTNLDYYQLIATGAVSYIWEPKIGLNCYDCPNPMTPLSNDTLNYFVIGTDEYGCIASDSLYFNQLTEIKPIENLSYKVFPNPSNQNIIFEFDSYINKLALVVYNSIGESVFYKENIDSAQIVLNKSDFNTGIYFYELVEKNNKKITRGKIVFLD